MTTQEEEQVINKEYSSVADAVSDIPDGATVMIGGFGASGSPIELIHALIDQGASNLPQHSLRCR